jgi:hypothetical protein
VKELLMTTGFGGVWLDQGVDNVDLFLKEFETRLKDIELQRIRQSIPQLSRA